jgi:hypothetical protein
LYRLFTSALCATHGPLVLENIAKTACVVNLAVQQYVKRRFAAVVLRIRICTMFKKNSLQA